jgi:MoaA/NifB/PqqE/SkfB family radical SAM enzyme
VTDACPYKCPHCFNYRKAQQPMPVDRLGELVGEIQEVGGSWICIHGGEPLVDIDRTMAVVEAADGRSEVWLATTGFGLDAEIARRLKRAGLYGACVSLHHHDPVEHDSFVGYPGAFGIAVDAVEHFRRAGVFVTLNTALTQERINQPDILSMMKLAKDLGAGMVEVLFIRPAGRAVVGCDQMLPEDGDLRVLEQAMALFNKHAEFGDYPVLVSPAYFETPDRFGCIAGSERIFISAAGDLQPCAMVNLSVGNVVEEAFADVASRLHRLLPRPRRDLICTQLQAIVREKADSGAGVELPLGPSLSVAVLQELPRSGPPGAYER